MRRAKRHALGGDLFAATTPDETRGAPPVPPPAPVVSPTAPRVPTAIGEVLRYVPAWLASLPLSSTLALRTRDGAELIATTSRTVHAALTAARVPALTGRDLGRLALGAENGRATPLAVDVWLANGGGAPNGPPTVSVAYAGAYALETPNHRWLLGDVLGAWGLTLVSVMVGDLDSMEVLG